MSWHCYILKSINPDYPNHTYVGMTNNIARRIRQHNGEIAGGAKATESKRPHEMYCIVSGFPSKSVAMSYEWRFKHPEGRKRSPQYSGINGRIRGMVHVLEKYPTDYELTINLSPQYMDLLDIDEFNE